MKKGDIILHGTDNRRAVVERAYKSVTQRSCLQLRNDIHAITVHEVKKVVGFECPYCGRKYDEPMTECESDDCPSKGKVSKQTAYENGSYLMPVPPVFAGGWKQEDWIAYIDTDGHWTVEVE